MVLVYRLELNRGFTNSTVVDGLPPRVSGRLSTTAGFFYDAGGGYATVPQRTESPRCNLDGLPSNLLFLCFPWL